MLSVIVQWYDCAWHHNILDFKYVVKWIYRMFFRDIKFVFRLNYTFYCTADYNNMFWFAYE